MSAPLTNKGPMAERLGTPWSCDRCWNHASPAYAVEAVQADLGPEFPERVHLVICQPCASELRQHGRLVDLPAAEVQP